MEWLSLIIPIICIIFCYVFFHSKIVWWEIVLPIIVPIIFIPSCNAINFYGNAFDQDIIGGYVVKAEYYEDWNERVPCRHPKYKTVTRRDSEGRTYTTQQFDGYLHSYDVDYHPEYYTCTDNLLRETSINKSSYKDIVSKFGNETFAELNRLYHTDDGDKYYTTKQSDVIIPIFKTESYINRVKNNPSFYPDVDSKDCPNYPEFNTWNPKSVIGIEGFDTYVNKHNALIGNLGVKITLVVMKDKPESESYALESKWHGGHRSDFVVCIGVSGDRANWCRCFCWSPDNYQGNHKIKANVRNFIVGKQIDIKSFCDYTVSEIKSNWKRKDFKEFDYVSVPFTTTNLVLLYILTFLASAGCCVWAVLNEVDNEGKTFVSKMPKFNWNKIKNMQLWSRFHYWRKG